jgi:hypothetical protein
MTWGNDSRSNNDAGRDDAAGRNGFSHRAERLLVRVLLALRREARHSSDRALDAQRAEDLADVILSDFPRRVIPFGIAALALITLVCSMPLLRDAMVGVSDGSAAVVPVANVVESSLRDHGAAMSDGIETIRAVVSPFAGESAAESANDEVEKVVPPSVAAAPFKKS